jgi:ubiquinone/menaquinone biosynthesis C-methylase UbiE
MRTTLRINYDTIAHLYDGQPFREKTVDPELVTFIAQRTFPNRPSILDIACGTGSQLVANRSVVPDALLIGLDRSLGMLRQAQPKLGNIAWVQADAAMLPFEPECFDFISCQFAFHHVRDKSGMLGAVLEVLRHGGRFVMRNLCPQECPDWLYYEYFPQAHTIDLEDFWPPETIVTTMEATELGERVDALVGAGFRVSLVARFDRPIQRLDLVFARLDAEAGDVVVLGQRAQLGESNGFEAAWCVKCSCSLPDSPKRASALAPPAAADSRGRRGHHWARMSR